MEHAGDEADDARGEKVLGVVVMEEQAKDTK